MPDREPIRCVSTTEQATATLNRDSAITAPRWTDWYGISARHALRAASNVSPYVPTPPRTGLTVPTNCADSLSSWIVRHGSVPASLIDRQAAGIAWDELRAQVAASGMLYRDEVLDVLDNTPVWIFDEKNQVVGGRKQRLMDLRGGEPYRYMLREFFPDLRSSVVVTLYFRSEETPESTQPPAVAPPPAPEPGLKPAENRNRQPFPIRPPHLNVRTKPGKQSRHL